MYKKLFLTAAIMATCIQTNAQTIAHDYKSGAYSNPISACVFCADPTALEYNGRLYVYGSNDHQQFIANGKKGDNSYGDIKSIVVFSTDDMVNWTFHGTIDTKKAHGIRAMAFHGHRQLLGDIMRRQTKTSSSCTSATAVMALVC